LARIRSIGIWETWGKFSDMPPRAGQGHLQKST
jgi:hypothetical protein